MRIYTIYSKFKVIIDFDDDDEHSLIIRINNYEL